MDAASAILAAADDPEIGAVVADSPFARLDEIATYRFSQAGRAGQTLGACTRWWAERIAGFSARDVAPAAVVARLAPRPLLIIHGDADLSTPLSQGRELYAAAREPKQLWIIPGAAHVACHTTAPAEYERRVTAFFRGALLGPGPS
jgi:pimeloyl-ACP methyl ester carboxylesterase